MAKVTVLLAVWLLSWFRNARAKKTVKKVCFSDIIMVFIIVVVKLSILKLLYTKLRITFDFKRIT